ncbi:MAG TPA: hypothetical protein PKK63_02155 [Bacillota bacterium]|nr:MAG: Cell division protein FtsL [Firmicutes bacterium ADurb.Bin153]HNV34316.1 hypothetical protein [Bacillota bacterium]HPU95716.1 hypothetical protein [Bacillota bacterium]
MRIYADSRPIAIKKRRRVARRTDNRAARRARASNPNSMMLSVSAIIFVAVLIAMGYLAQRSAVISAYSQIDALESQIAGLKQVYNEKSMELAELNSMAKVEKVARERLGMVDVTNTALLLRDKAADKPAVIEEKSAQTGPKGIARLEIEVPTVLAIFGSWLKSTAISATSSMISTWHANANGSLPEVLQ